MRQGSVNNSCSKSDEPKPVVSRLLGVYPQRQTGLFMQRIKIFGGRISWPQWRKIAQLADSYSQCFPLHITTRQDVELHNIKLNNIPKVHQDLAEVALTTFGACGDSIRNMTICSKCDFCPDGLDLLPLAQLVRQHLEQQSVIFNLPRKFKISFSGCEQACAKPWLNDLGFIAKHNGLFTVIGAGSLGPKPALGIQLYKDLPAKDVLPLCIAAVEFFEQYGDRENRRRARFRHVRERLGDHAFRAELDARFSRLKKKQSWPDISPVSGDKTIKMLCRLQLPNGNIKPKEALELADAAEPKGALLRINIEHGLELYGTQKVSLPEKLSVLENNLIFISCPGSAACSRGLTDCWTTADNIRKALVGQQPKEVLISISGCPNNCAQSVVADIGLVGMLRKKKDQQAQYYRVYTSGGNGRNDRLAEQSNIVCAQDVPSAIEDLLGRVKARKV